MQKTAAERIRPHEQTALRVQKACGLKEIRRLQVPFDPDLSKALAMLEPEKFIKMVAYLESPLGQRVRTNNHVERTNRRLRYLEKVRYKWRRRRTIVRFVVLAFTRWRKRQASDDLNKSPNNELHQQSPDPNKKPKVAA